MERLNRKVAAGKKTIKEYPVKVLQFGEGNFLRAFADLMLNMMNEKGAFGGSVAVVKPIPAGDLTKFRVQEGVYTVSLRGQKDGEVRVENHIVTCISDTVDVVTEYERYAAYAACETLRFVISNTTEAGIVYEEADSFADAPPKTYPAKLTKFLYERFLHFHGDKEKGLIILPCELIEDNGGILKECVKRYAKRWALGDAFDFWLEEGCCFCTTLVDRIVTGYPKDEFSALWNNFGYEDRLLTTGELFGLWVIESPWEIAEELPLAKAGLPVVFTKNQKPYRERKVRILNGAHTSFVLASYLAGNNFVGESMRDKTVRQFMEETLFTEIIPTLSLPREDCEQFARAVIERFENPFIKHALLDISLNSVSKWKARCKDSLTGYMEKFGRLPVHLTFSLAALLSFYTSDTEADGALLGTRGTDTYRIRDNAEVLAHFKKYSKGCVENFVQETLAKEAFWGEDMTRYTGLTEAVLLYLQQIKEAGMRAALEAVIYHEG